MSRSQGERLRFLGVATFSLSMLVFAVLPGSAGLLYLAVGFTLMGIGFGLYYPRALQSVMGSVPAEESSAASSTMSNIRSLAQLLGVVVFETLFSRTFTNPKHVDTATRHNAVVSETLSSSFSGVFLVATFVSALALLPLYLMMKNGADNE